MNFVGSGSGIWAGLTNPDLLQMENAFQRTLQGPEYGQTQKRQEPSGRAAPQVSVCTEARRIFSRGSCLQASKSGQRPRVGARTGGAGAALHGRTEAQGPSSGLQTLTVLLAWSGGSVATGKLGRGRQGSITGLRTFWE